MICLKKKLQESDKRLLIHNKSWECSNKIRNHKQTKKIQLYRMLPIQTIYITSYQTQFVLLSHLPMLWYNVLSFRYWKRTNIITINIEQLMRIWMNKKKTRNMTPKHSLISNWLITVKKTKEKQWPHLTKKNSWYPYHQWHERAMKWNNQSIEIISTTYVHWCWLSNCFHCSMNMNHSLGSFIEKQNENGYENRIFTCH